MVSSTRITANYFYSRYLWSSLNSIIKKEDGKEKYILILCVTDLQVDDLKYKLKVVFTPTSYCDVKKQWSWTKIEVFQEKEKDFVPDFILNHFKTLILEYENNDLQKFIITPYKSCHLDRWLDLYFCEKFHCYTYFTLNMLFSSINYNKYFKKVLLQKCTCHKISTNECFCELKIRSFSNRNFHEFVNEPEILAESFMLKRFQI